MPMNYEALIPPLTLSALKRWAEGPAYMPGGFVTSVLENDLALAIGTADDDNLRSMKYIVMYVCNEMPLGSWGSRQKVKDWFLQHKSAGAV